MITSESYPVLYLCCNAPVIIWLGLHFYKHGVMLTDMWFPLQKTVYRSVNKLLLMGYYLLNLGYIILTLFRNPIQPGDDWLGKLAIETGLIYMVLASIHFINIGVLFYLNQKNLRVNSLSNLNKFQS